MIYILNTLAPIFLMIALGWVLRRKGFADEAFFKSANKLVYWVGLPALLFIKTSSTEPPGSTAFKLMTTMLVSLTAVMVIGYGLCLIFGVRQVSRGALVQAAFRGNLAYIGLPVILLAFQNVPNLTGERMAQIESLTMLALAPTIPAYNILAVIVLLAGSHEPGSKLSERLLNVLKNLLTNPLILACVAGIGWSFVGWKMPTFINRSCTGLGQMSLPLALLCIGASLKVSMLKGNTLYTGLSSFLKLVISPLIGYVIARWLGLGPEEMLVAMVLCTTPTAVASYVLCEQLKGDHELGATIIIVSTLLSLPAFSIILAIFGLT